MDLPVRPEASGPQSLAAEIDLHRPAVEDAVLTHYRSKPERDHESLFVVLRAAHLESRE
ncbi:hypothetical protein [Paenarthrobacter ureafaciens]|uniref:hypothetical protein n=1 Tax=Paenarthrobacter ureafaciens TaxID=37931 RepID=UPI001C2C908A|nr:hypothetical protein [Paenarthrobacter ureafaciens]